MTTLMTPSANELLHAVRSFGPAVRENAAVAEREGRLQPAVIDALHGAGVFRMALPRDLGGLGLDLPESQRVIEELAFLDGAVGWCSMIGAGGGIFSGWLTDDVTRQLYADDHTVIGGTFMPSGQARDVPGGYRVTGRWAYGSGCLHSTHMIGNCLLLDGDAPRLDAKGAPQTMMVILPREELQIVDNWSVSGLRATGSHDFAATDLFVPRELTLRPFHERARRPGGVLRLPFQAVLWLWMAPVPLGIARGALDGVRELAAHKVPIGPERSVLRDRSWVQTRYAEATASLDAARALLDSVTTEALGYTDHDEDCPPELLARIGIAARHSARTAERVTETALELGGASALRDDSGISRAFRDAHAAARHVAFGHANDENGGRTLLES